MIEREDDCITWPLHIGKIYPNLGHHLKAVSVKDLLPFQVDYALAIVLDLPAMELQYMADLKYALVLFRSDRKLWAPTQCIEQARHLPKKLSGTENLDKARNRPEIFRRALAAAGYKEFRIPSPQSFDR